MESTVGSAQAALRAQRVADQTRAARAKFRHTVIALSFFAILIGGGLLSGAATLIPDIQAHFKQEDVAAKYKTAKISRPMLDGVFCHNLVLDNKTGQSVEDKVERCDAENLAPRRGQTQFVWGVTK